MIDPITLFFDILQTGLLFVIAVELNQMRKVMKRYLCKGSGHSPMIEQLQSEGKL